MKDLISKEDKISNQLFAKYLIENGLVLEDDIIIELARSIHDSISISPSFTGFTRLIYSTEIPKTEIIYDGLGKSLGKNKYQINFISNYFSKKVKSYLTDVYAEKSFNIGVCTHDNDEFILGKLALIDYQKELIANGINVTSMENKLERNNHIYLLTNRGNKNGK